MNLRTFLERGEPQWRRVEGMLGLATRVPARGGKGKGRSTRQENATRKAAAVAAEKAPASSGVDGGTLPDLFRRACRDLALARHRGYALSITDRLNRIAVAAHARLYRQRALPWSTVGRFFARDFPQAVRGEWRLFALLSLLFYGPGVVVFLLVTWRPELVFTILDPQSVATLEEMYAADGPAGELQREASSDVLMFGMYIWNNVSIDFMTFAGGLVFTLGALFYTIFNAVYFGAIFAHLTNVGSGERLYSFVVGHGAFELTALVLSAVAGTRLGLALLAPGRRTRGEALRHAAGRAMPVLLGAAAMTSAAAVIEAFWSPRDLDPVAKYAFGAIIWPATFAYLLFAGRGDPDAA